MGRRFEDGRIYEKTVLLVSAGSGVVELAAADADKIYQPRSALISSHAGGAFEFNLLQGSTPFLHGHIGSNDSRAFAWPKGYELPKGSGIFIEGLVNDGSISIYYGCHDESAGVTKVAARTAAFDASNLTPKATRAPNTSPTGPGIVGDKS